MFKDFVEIVRVRAMFCLKLSMKLFVPRVLEVKNSSGFLEKQFCSSGAVIKRSQLSIDILNGDMTVIYCPDITCAPSVDAFRDQLERLDTFSQTEFG